MLMLHLVACGLIGLSESHVLLAVVVVSLATLVRCRAQLSTNLATTCAL
jgi:hypothetical protein